MIRERVASIGFVRWLLMIAIGFVGRLLPIAVVGAVAGGAVLATGFSRDGIQYGIERRYARVHHIDAATLEKLDRDEVVIFDIRAQSEFAVSHIEWAIRVEPDADPASFIDTHGGGVAGKTVIFYCSVGRRSSALLARVQDAIIERGAHTTYNLKGGVFQWHNEARPLMQNGRLTRFIHPYNRFWGRLIDDKASIRQEPDAVSVNPGFSN